MAQFGSASECLQWVRRTYAGNCNASNARFKKSTSCVCESIFFQLTRIPDVLGEKNRKKIIPADRDIWENQDHLHSGRHISPVARPRKAHQVRTHWSPITCAILHSACGLTRQNLHDFRIRHHSRHEVAHAWRHSTWHSTRHSTRHSTCGNAPGNNARRTVNCSTLRAMRVITPNNRASPNDPQALPPSTSTHVLTGTEQEMPGGATVHVFCSPLVYTRGNTLFFSYMHSFCTLFGKSLCVQLSYIKSYTMQFQTMHMQITMHNVS